MVYLLFCIFKANNHNTHTEMESISENIKIGQKFYYPSNTGIALICEVLAKSKKDVMVKIADGKFYLPMESIDQHAILLDDEKSKVYVTQRIDDPENKMVYMRYKFKETIIDRFYNWYCKKSGRIDTFVIKPEEPTKAIPAQIENN